MSEDADTDNDNTLADNVRLHQQCLTRLIYSSLIALVMLLSLLALVAFLAYSTKLFEQQQQDTAMHRLNQLGEKTSQALKTIKVEHRKHKDYLKKNHLLPLVERHEDFYQELMTSEAAYTDAIAAYQAYIFDIAGRIRGSGEWHSYYTRRLDLFQHRSLNRSRYLHSLKPVPEDETKNAAN